MLSMYVGRTLHAIKKNDALEMGITFNKDRIEYWVENPSPSGPVKKSFLKRIIHVTLNIKGESDTREPVKIEAFLTLPFTEARELAENLLRAAREAEASIEQNGQDD